MSKPLSFGFGKPKEKPTSSTPTTAPKSRIALAQDPLKRPLHADSDSEDDSAPRHESVTGFDVSTGGAISATPSRAKEELVIKNPGNADWRRRGRGRQTLPAEEQARRMEQTNGSTHEVDEVSKAAGLQFAVPKPSDYEEQRGKDISMHTPNGSKEDDPSTKRSEDEIALEALLNDGDGKRRTNLVIQQSGNANLSREHDEAAALQADLADLPDSSTLEEYAAVPVEDFGLAMLRGMGTKRKANGQPVNLESNLAKTSTSKAEKQQRAGYLGIGAKGMPAGAEIELGAWGKADMRRNKKGEGLYTPVMLKDRQTGELITEEEFEKRKKAAKDGREEDWRDRRDRDSDERRLGGSDDYKNAMNTFSRTATSQRDRNPSRERRNGHSGRDRSHSRDRRRRHTDDRSYRRHRDEDDDSRHRSNHSYDRHRDKGYREDRDAKRDRHQRRRSMERDDRYRRRD
ncbi:MAG: hypothetical protein Q9227_003310 [Pyrenula ochraceoflavens]